MTVERFTSDALIRRSETLLHSRLGGGEIMIMDVQLGDYYGLETVAARIWDLTEQPISVGAICEQLVAEYDVSADQCRADVLVFLDELVQRKMVCVELASDAQ